MFILESQGSDLNDERMAGARKWFLIFTLKIVFNRSRLGMGRPQIHLGTTGIRRRQRAVRAVRAHLAAGYRPLQQVGLRLVDNEYNLLRVDLRSYITIIILCCILIRQR